MSVINCHSHVLNFNFVPDAFFRTRAPIREKVLRRWWARRLVQLVSRLLGWIPGIGYPRLHQAFKIMNWDIENVAKTLVDEMDGSDPKIAMTTPLMMDLELSCGQEPEVPYDYQILALSRLVHQYPGRILPFVMVDPQRPDAARRTIDCLENRGFLGVKLYPPLGYHPDPTSIVNAPEVNKELDELYAYCAQHGVPITAHCSRGGAYNQELVKAREVCRECAFPTNWIGVLAEERYEGLRLNLGHFGGDLLQLGEPSAWSTEICSMMDRFPNLYTDVSYHSAALRRKTRDEYYEILNRLIDDSTKAPSRRILFGTDWPMTRHTWRERDYVSCFASGCGPDRLQQIGFNNPLTFLFGTGGLPERYLSFLRRHGKSAPVWLLEAFGVAEPIVDVQPAAHSTTRAATSRR